VRPVERYGEGHLRGSIAVPLKDSFTVWLGWVVPWGTRIVLVADREAEAADAARRARGIGFEDIAGWTTFEELVEAGLPVAETEMIDAAELERRLASPTPPALVDVRGPAELVEGKIPGSLSLEAGRIASGEIPSGLEGPLVTHCATGSRATVSAAVLERAGIGPVAVFPGGVQEWRDSGRALETPSESRPRDSSLT
jgi:hydroxyacylglutathione hydrolase